MRAEVCESGALSHQIYTPEAGLDSLQFTVTRAMTGFDLLQVLEVNADQLGDPVWFDTSQVRLGNSGGVMF